MSTLVGFLLVSAIVVAAYKIALLHSMARWGATPEEWKSAYPCDAYLEPMEPAHVRFTRSISLMAPPEAVWPWVAQIGRGAGWYAYDRLDNLGKKSADRLVDWIPPPRVGDCTAIGWLAEIEPMRSLSYNGSVPKGFLGARMRMAVTYRLNPAPYGTRLVVRLNTDFQGPTAVLVLRVFEIFDFMLAQRQLVKIKRCVEAWAKRPEGPTPTADPARNAYQAYETIYADGNRAGEPDAQEARPFRRWVESLGVTGTSAPPGAS